MSPSASYQRSMNIDYTWAYCCSRRTSFPERYAVFTYYTRKRYTVKSGIAYGVDFVVYTSSPLLHHSRYAVLVAKEKETIPWSHLQCLCRLMQDISKILLVCTVKPNFALQDGCSDSNFSGGTSLIEEHGDTYSSTAFGTMKGSFISWQNAEISEATVRSFRNIS